MFVPFSVTKEEQERTQWDNVLTSTFSENAVLCLAWVDSIKLTTYIKSLLLNPLMAFLLFKTVRRFLHFRSWTDSVCSQCLCLCPLLSISVSCGVHAASSTCLPQCDWFGFFFFPTWIKDSFSCLFTVQLCQTLTRALTNEMFRCAAS